MQPLYCTGDSYISYALSEQIIHPPTQLKYFSSGKRKLIMDVLEHYWDTANRKTNTNLRPSHPRLHFTTLLSRYQLTHDDAITFY